ncbi:hypothetical protein [Pantoea vagans]|uniref:hypothetical protein n=1 Tax=Pantoea vagans TaxID=470934 RepID=UPI001EE1F086|nr:hypothetical protein [Pantoea vagans]
MKKVYIPFIIGFSSFSMASVLAANAGFVSVTRTLSPDSSANISSSSSLMHAIWILVSLNNLHCLMMSTSKKITNIGVDLPVFW